ncbi:MAG: VWA-like domain-containing protein [Bacteroidota bacterium]
MREQILKEIADATYYFLLKEPFYGHFFSGMVRQVTEDIPTLGIMLRSDLKISLAVNPTYWTEDLKKREHKLGLLKHEILHVVLGHVIEGKKYAQQDVFNLAADLVVNQYIPREWLPGEPVTLEAFPHLFLQPHQSVAYYYEKLLEEKDKQMQQPPQSQPQNGEGSPAQGEAGDQQEQDQNQASNAWEETVSQFEDETKNHESWQDFYEQEEAESRIIEDELAEQVQEVKKAVPGKDHGLMSAGLQERLEVDQRHTSPINWRRMLRLFAASSRRSRLHHTMKRPSKRYGTNPGIRVRPRQRLLVAVDTSGSVNEKEARLFFEEIDLIWRQGVEVEIVECDTEIKASYFYKGKKPDKIRGRGGTNFNPPLVYAKEKSRPDALVYFTDGEAPAPKVKCRIPMLWIISPDGIKEESNTWQNLPGQVVKMPRL